MKRTGLTLIEMLVVLVVLATLATVAMQTVEPKVQQARFEATQQTLENVRHAVIGRDDERQADGTPLVSGFVADIGRLPMAVGNQSSRQLAELWTADPTGDGVADLLPFALVPADQVSPPLRDTEVLVPRGWRGPYLRLPVGASTLADGWGHALALQFGSNGLTSFGSLGADQLAGGASYDLDLHESIAPANATAVVTGTIFALNGGERVAPAGTLTLRLFEPQADNFATNGVRATSVPVVAADPLPTFSFSTSIGTRVLRVYSGTTAKHKPLYFTARPGVQTLAVQVTP